MQILPAFEDWLAVKRNCSPSTLNHHKYQIRIILSKSPEFTEKDCFSFIRELKLLREPGTVENYIYTIRVFCAYLVDCGIINYNFGKNMPLPKREEKLPEILTITEIEKLIATDIPVSYSRYPDPDKARRVFDTILKVLSKTGARIGEVLNMSIGDINWEESVWRLNHTKTRKGRLIPIAPDDLISMKMLIVDRNPEEKVFINPRGGNPVSQQCVGENFRRRLGASGIKKRVTIHTLRHSFITELLRQDVSVLKIASIAGHESIETTQAYAKLLYEDLRDAIMRHPMVAKNRNPYDIIKHIKETINKFHLKEDSRFFYEVSEMSDGIKINIFMR